MGSLESILDEIKTKKAVVSQDIDGVHPQVRSHKIGQIAKAKEDLEVLHSKYKNQLLSQAAVMLVVGDKAKEFADLSAKEFDTFSIDMDLLFKEVANKIDPAVWLKRPAGVYLFETINNLIENSLRKTDVLSVPRMTFQAKYGRSLNSKADLIKVIREAVNDQMGAAVTLLYAAEEVATQGIKAEYSSKIVPILMYTDDDTAISNGVLQEYAKVLGVKGALIKAGETKNPVIANISVDSVTVDTVQSTLMEVRKLL